MPLTVVAMTARQHSRGSTPGQKRPAPDRKIALALTRLVSGVATIWMDYLVDLGVPRREAFSQVWHQLCREMEKVYRDPKWDDEEREIARQFGPNWDKPGVSYAELSAYQRRYKESAAARQAPKQPKMPKRRKSIGARTSSKKTSTMMRPFVDTHRSTHSAGRS